MLLQGGTPFRMSQGFGWRDRAAEALAQPHRLTDPQFKHALLEIAAGYERLAQRAEQPLRPIRDISPLCGNAPAYEALCGR